jgi:hypothetical protein
MSSPHSQNSSREEEAIKYDFRSKIFDGWLSSDFIQLTVMCWDSLLGEDLG